jgi:hypothetical protein
MTSNLQTMQLQEVYSLHDFVGVDIPVSNGRILGLYVQEVEKKRTPKPPSHPVLK